MLQLSIFFFYSNAVFFFSTKLLVCSSDNDARRRGDELIVFSAHSSYGVKKSWLPQWGPTAGPFAVLSVALRFFFSLCEMGGPPPM